MSVFLLALLFVAYAAVVEVRLHRHRKAWVKAQYDATRGLRHASDAHTRVDRFTGTTRPITTTRRGISR